MKRADQADRIDVADRYAKLLQPYAKRLNLRHDGPGSYVLETKAKSYEVLVRGKWQTRKAPFPVAAIRAGKAYVSFHFVPVYMFADLVGEYAPSLKSACKGKGVLISRLTIRSPRAG